MTDALIRWYRASHRDLPWRAVPSPYHVWLSEIMLQQTRVEAVKGYYLRFLDSIPDIETLADANEETLLKLWEGLGYYSRVRNLQKAARIIVSEYGGTLPSEVAELKKLPGIGDYTAGAVASIAYGKRAALVDGNVLRVMARLREDTRDIALAETKKAVLSELTSDYLPEKDTDCGTFNQALMELGAVVCVPNGPPLCNDCPVRAHCLAAQNGTQTSFPVKSAKKPRRIEHRTVLLLCDRTRIALRRRPAKGLLAGLYEYPSVAGHLSMQDVRRVLKQARIPALRIQTLPDAKHVFTHIEWLMKGYLVLTETFPDNASRFAAFAADNAFPDGLLFADRTDVADVYAIPSAFQAYTAVVRDLLAFV